jgi:Na+/H+ antiporter NhaC
MKNKFLALFSILIFSIQDILANDDDENPPGWEDTGSGVNDETAPAGAIDNIWFVLILILGILIFMYLKHKRETLVTKS